MKQHIRKYLIRYKWFRRLPIQVKYTLECMVYRDQQEGEWVASCLDLGLIATGVRKQDATKNLKDIIVTQIQHTAENNNWEYLFNSAPEDEWQKLAQVKRAHIERCIHEQLETSALRRPIDLCFA